MRIFQEHLPFNDAGSNSEKRAVISWLGSWGNWWYIEHGNNPHKCMYADEVGMFYFGQKELSRVVPVVWNLRKEAARVARKHGGRVRKYPYKLKPR